MPFLKLSTNSAILSPPVATPPFSAENVAELAEGCDVRPARRWYLYVILNPNRLAYTGIATDLDRRLAEHNAGRGAKFTRGRGPWVAVYCEGPFNQGTATRREAEVKRDRGLKAALKDSAA